MIRSTTRSIPGHAVRLVVIIVALLFTACSGSVPEILYPDAQLFLQRDLTTGEVFESLRLFVAVRDEDGTEDLASLFVIHDDSEIRWEIDSEQWVTREQGGDSWIGVPDLRMADHSPLPRGRYRVIVEDAAMQATESSFVISAESLSADTTRFPMLTSDGKIWRAVFDAPVILRVYSRTGQQLVSRELEPGQVDDEIIAELPNESGLTAYLWTLQNQPVRLLVGPFDIGR